MLSTTKNTLLNKVLRLEIDINEAIEDMNKQIEVIPNYMKNVEKIGNHNKALTIISDNLTSIKKQLKKL